MNVSSLEIKKQEFKQSLRGYDPVEVRAFLEMLAMQWSELQAEQRRSEDKIVELKAKLEHYERVEVALQEALQTARDSSRHALENAQQEANLIVKEAEGKAEDIKRAAKRERDQLHEDVQRLLSRRDELVARLRAFLLSEVELLSRYESQVQQGSGPGAVPISTPELSEVLATLESGDDDEEHDLAFLLPDLEEDGVPLNMDELDDVLDEVEGATPESTKAKVEAPKAAKAPEAAAEEPAKKQPASPKLPKAESVPGPPAKQAETDSIEPLVEEPVGETSGVENVTGVGVPEIEVEYFEEEKQAAEEEVPAVEDAEDARAPIAAEALAEPDASLEETKADVERFMPTDERFMTPGDAPGSQFYEEKEPLSFRFFEPQEAKQQRFFEEQKPKKAPKGGEPHEPREPIEGAAARHRLDENADGTWIVRPVVSAPHMLTAEAEERTASTEEIDKIRRILNDLE